MKKEQPVGLYTSFLLFCIAFVLFMTTAPIGFIYALLKQLVVKKIKTLPILFLEVAIALDIAGNVMMQHLLNDTLLLKNAQTYYFGNKKETISSVIGKNSLTHTLSWLGEKVNAFLNFLDKGHALDSIMYDLRLWKKDHFFAKRIFK